MGEEVQMVRRSVVTGAAVALLAGPAYARDEVLKKTGRDPVFE